ncbi:hypothetical protein ASPWEDRAFT_449405 [Aspergillus wentii DTO 134E9]|uniref:Kelch repeat protein n=1 Tax=Aspergillus wentii DTO 134E9 TaxID=1073089 RepID=A0A1L9RQV7_ASPWE|nr:uncharacterized protein ASPWEDRAFT_449405 [Aspergillus wentii DTO 134E9]KAI9928176.1 hypothetical protein MW887_002209 [Aspergillus wentii]OJJ37340.1 hypothetical protein ASPWEDRAFT_449405 [Aspergillus wentii DTO 134E9]
MTSAKWTQVCNVEILERSSQLVSLIKDDVYIFGGELRPREPRDNHVHTLSLKDKTSPRTINLATPHVPSPRVGTASTTLNGKIYLFSGRGGIAMAPIEENGAVWEFDPSTSTWTLLLPEEPTPSSSTDCTPVARSYHCMTSNGTDTLYVHAGCPESGRLCDLWAFRVSNRQWTQLASAPDPARGGTSITFANGNLYRMNGFDGNTEQGGKIDIYDVETNDWSSLAFTPDGKNGPVPRSVGTLLPMHVKGDLLLLTLFGEGNPSSLGHQGAGKMLGDVWAFNVSTGKWSEVDVQGDRPCPRGWFAADIYGNTVVVQGGLSESNQRLGDVWALSF